MPVSFRSKVDHNAFKLPEVRVLTSTCYEELSVLPRLNINPFVIQTNEVKSTPTSAQEWLGARKYFTRHQIHSSEEKFTKLTLEIQLSVNRFQGQSQGRSGASVVCLIVSF